MRHLDWTHRLVRCGEMRVIDGVSNGKYVIENSVGEYACCKNFASYPVGTRHVPREALTEVLFEVNDPIANEMGDL